MGKTTKKLSPETCEAVVRAVQAGGSYRTVARTFGVSPAAVGKIARAAGVGDPARRLRTKRATAAFVRYAKAERTALLDELFNRVRALAPSVTKPQGMKDLALATGILIDKARLEEGEATSRSEVTTGSARERIAARLDDLTARVRNAEAAVPSTPVDGRGARVLQ